MKFKMKTKQKHLLEGIIGDLVSTLLIAGCAVSSVLKGVEPANKFRYSEPIKTIEIKNNHSSRIEDLANLDFILKNNKTNKISEGDLFLLNNKYQKQVAVEDSFVSKEDIHNYLNEIYGEIKVPKVIDKKFVEYVIQKESSRNKFAINKDTGAKGLMQLREIAWNEVNNNSNYEEQWHNPKENIKTGVKYLSQLVNHCDNNYPNWRESSQEEKQEMIAAAYNWGIGKLIENEWNLNRIPQETKDYIQGLELSQARSYQDNTKIN